MLEVKNVQVNYGDFVAVKDLNFSIKPGEIFGLLGTNGAGKTTTFRVMMGLLEPVSGEVLYNGQKIGYHNTDEIGYMIEERSLFTKMTVFDLMQFFGALKGMDKKLIEKKLDYWLERFKIVDYKNKKVKELSKGNQQKIQFISAIINDPKLLILDEPFSGLDPLNTILFVDVINELKDNGTMIIFSSHQIDHVEKFCEKLLVLDKGVELFGGYIKDIKNDFKKHTIKIIGNVPLSELKPLEGVLDVNEDAKEISVKIAKKANSKLIFDKVRHYDITKYEVEQAALSEIFIAKVGQSYEEI